MKPHAALLVLLALVMAGCGILQPTPARFRPPLPDPEPMPGLEVGAVVEALGRLGYECHFEPPSDIGGGWSCGRGQQDEQDDFGIGISGGAEGPIDDVGATQRILLGPDQGPEPAVLDRAALANFYPLVEIVVPEAVRPSEEQLLDGILRNYPIELGDGWFIGFDRSSVHRTIRIVYSSIGD